MAYTNGVHVVPAIRCQHRDEGERSIFCGNFASWYRRAAAPFAPRYFCHKHKRPADVEIPNDGELPRVRLMLDVFVGGVSWNAGEAEREAAEVIRLAIATVGGVSSPISVTSAIVTWRAARPVGEAIVDAGDPTQPPLKH